MRADAAARMPRRLDDLHLGVGAEETLSHWNRPANTINFNGVARGTVTRWCANALFITRAKTREKFSYRLDEQ